MTWVRQRWSSERNDEMKRYEEVEVVLERADYLAFIGMTRQSRNLVKVCFVSGLVKMSAI